MLTCTWSLMKGDFKENSGKCSQNLLDMTAKNLFSLFSIMAAPLLTDNDGYLDCSIDEME